MSRKDKIIIDAEDLRTLTIREVMEKYGCSDSVVTKRRNELGIQAVKSRRPPKEEIPPEIRKKMYRMYAEDGLTLQIIYQRFRQYGQDDVRKAIVSEGAEIVHTRRIAAGWCST